jgi:MoaA/NifB/PqqE/SkfB family radical SAM enzyme/GT2 family glycosyltransferase
MKQDLLSIVIPVHNDTLLILELLPSLKRQIPKEVEIIVVADRCQKDFLDSLENNEGIQIFQTKHLFGPAAARNLGAQKAQGKWLLFLDSDLCLEEGSFQALEAFLENPGNYRAAGGCDSFRALRGDSPEADFMAFYVWKTLTDIDNHDINFFGTRHALIEKELFFEIGQFNVAYERADVEDYEFSIRLGEKTRVLNLPDFLFQHHFPDRQRQIYNYFRRSRLYAPLLLKRKNNIGVTSQNSIIAVCFSLLGFFFLFAWPFFGPLALAFPLFFWSLACLGQYSLFRFWVQEKSSSSLLKVAFHYIVLMGAGGLGLLIGFGELLMKKNLKAYHALKRAFIFTRCYFKKKEPVYLIFFVTGNCNARCPFCFNLDTVSAPPGEDLDLQHVEKIARAFPYLLQLTLSGGEPFMRQDIVELVEIFYRRSSVRNLTIATNGFLTEIILARTREMARRMPEMSIRLSVSLDALGDKHDALRKLPGSFERAKNLLRQLNVLSASFPNIITSLISVYSGYNEKDLEHFLNWSQEKLDVHMQSLLLARGDIDAISRKTRADTFLRLSKLIDEQDRKTNDQRRFFHRLLGDISRKTRQKVYEVAKNPRDQSQFFNCVAGKRLLVLWENGELAPCEIIDTLDWVSPHLKEYKHFRFGNIKKDELSPREMFFSPRGERIRDFIKREKCTCTFECAIAASQVFKSK